MSSRSRRKQTSSQEATADTDMQDASAVVQPPLQATAEEADEDSEEGVLARQIQSEDVAAEEDGEALEGEDDDDDDEDVQRVRLLPGSTPTAASFEFLEEGHTLGNALRFIIMKNPDVEFCAYAIPHPAEPKMNIRIQTYGTQTDPHFNTPFSAPDGTAIEALEKGLRDLQDLCDVVGEKYWSARNEFATSMEVQ